MAISYQNKIRKVYLCQALNPSVVSSIILLADFKAGCCSNTAQVPLLRLRKARNFKKGGLHKENLILVQLNAFKNLLREGGIYGLRGVDVAGIAFH
ncbi:LOW QUALITY PROTEIN: hypothetical protein HID58_054106 [Brassica napus]|uniref:Uncharacterized protein n=1 Tax=Brassica napus TaxID=3708 RepID=A0ABQ8AGK7_BRANA|nr:LOW QUALITY PROTEIN: hypothetical protein HID58_054106 [Brassica napus]